MDWTPVQNQGHRSCQSSSVGEMLKQLNWTSLEEQRKRTHLTTLYKYHHGHILTETEHALVTSQGTHINTSMPWNLVPGTSENFFLRTTKHFNRLSFEAVKSTSVESFQSYLKPPHPLILPTHYKVRPIHLRLKVRNSECGGPQPIHPVPKLGRIWKHRLLCRLEPPPV